MYEIEKAMSNLDNDTGEFYRGDPVPFEVFLERLIDVPNLVLRNIFQLFHDMITRYVDEGIDEYKGDPESIHYSYYDCSRLFIEGLDHPFLADRLFANRLFDNIEAMRSGAQQNKIYIFQGPHGSGKSTFLNNLLLRLEEYANTEEGCCYEVIWRLDRRILGGLEEIDGELRDSNPYNVIKTIRNVKRESYPDTSDETSDHESGELLHDRNPVVVSDSFIEVPCPSHDHPILLVPKHLRRVFLDDLFKNNKPKFELFTQKEYEWVFRKEPCTICSSLYLALLKILKNARKVMQMLYVRPYQFNRRIGEGITIFSPSDKPLKQHVMTNEVLQKRIDHIFGDSNKVKHIYSRFAKTNNGVYALMDIKSHNVQRLIDLHNIISEGIHKIEDTEEHVNSLFLALMNPEDKKNVEEFQSFSDRITYINIHYIMDIHTEVEIYKSVFGRHIESHFLPKVLLNFARVVVYTRMKPKSEAVMEWIEEPKKYSYCCDENLQLLKMEIYTGRIPTWLTESDRNRFTAKRRRKIIREGETEGIEGLSGRDSITIFNDFFSFYAEEDKLINMSNIYEFFTKKVSQELKKAVPKSLLNSLMDLYNYEVLQQVKEALYYYNEDEIARDIMNYMYAVNFDLGSVCECSYTGDKIKITEEFMEGNEGRFLGSGADKQQKQEFRRDTQKEYTSRTLPQEIQAEGMTIDQTKLYESLHERYVRNLKENVFDPFIDNQNFRRGILDYNTPEFRTYDNRIRNDVTYMIKNLCTKFHYTEMGAREVCLYLIDNDIPRKFAEK